MQAIKLKAEVGPDHRLQIVVPDEIPVGAVEVIVLASPPTAPRQGQTLGELFTELDRMPHKRLTNEEVERYLAEERETWN